MSKSSPRSRPAWPAALEPPCYANQARAVAYERGLLDALYGKSPDGWSFEFDPNRRAYSLGFKQGRRLVQRLQAAGGAVYPAGSERGNRRHGRVRG